LDRRVRKFFNGLLETHSTLFEAKRVLEYGSMTRSGVPRNLFGKAEEYVGVDWRDGPGVDAVSLMHDYKDKPNEYFDLAVSTSALEHDPHWVHSITRVHKLPCRAHQGKDIITISGWEKCWTIRRSIMDIGG